MASPRTVRAGATEARARLGAAQAYLEVADLVLGQQEGDEFLNVSAGLSVLAGIAAADAICARRLGRIHRGSDHRGAADLLEGAAPDGARLAATFRRLIDVKQAAHYGVLVVASGKAADAGKWARTLVVRAREEVER